MKTPSSPKAPSKKTQRNDEIENLVKQAGIACKLENDDANVVDEDEWNAARETFAAKLLAQDTSIVPQFWQDKYEREAAKNWDKFYKRNTTNFYKDRHYIHLVFPELAENPNDNSPKTLLEIGCGVGNAALPLLEVNSKIKVIAMDFSSTAIEFIKTQPLFDPERCSAHVVDITKDELPEEARGQIDFALCMFCLSAVHPDRMKDAAANIAKALKPGGKLMFRDYGRYDQAQLRFGKGKKLQDNFYVRQDLTRAYYFTTEELRELFEEAGLVVEELEYIRRQYRNRKQGTSRFRVWIHAKFRKPETKEATA